MIKILPNTRFSTNYTTGSMARRIKTMDSLNEQFFQSAIKLFEKKNTCNISSLRKCYKQFLPENKKIDIIPIPRKASQDFNGIVSINESNNTFKGYEIEITVRKKHNREYLHIKNLPDFMHESAHILDYFLNPKFVFNVKKMTELGIFDKKYFELYDNLYYNDDLIENFDIKNKDKMLEHIKTETEKALENVPTNKKITFLNYLKYSMLTEYNAYNQDFKFTNIIKNLRNFKSVKEYENWNKYYFFPEKIELINQMLRNIIENERNKLAGNVHKNKAKNIFTGFLSNIKDKIG